MIKPKLLGAVAVLGVATLLLNHRLAAAADESTTASSPLPATVVEATNASAKAYPGPDSGNTATNPSHADLLQDQQRLFLRAVEQIRQEANAAARQNAESITSRLNGIEQALAGQRQSELEAIQKWNMYTLIIVGGFAMLGFLGLLLVAPFLVRSLNRMSDAATTLRLQEHMRTALPPPGASDLALLGNPVVTQSTTRFLEAMERVERRIQQLEHTVEAPGSALEPHSNGSPRVSGAHHDPDSLPEAAEPTRASLAPVRTELVLEKGQALLHLGQAERALACFDEALSVEPDCAEVHVKRGQALEKLKRPEESLACYDRAIALEKSTTTAYLLKGSLLNQLGRYNEALQCYELALRVQQGERVATG